MSAVHAVPEPEPVQETPARPRRSLAKRIADRLFLPRRDRLREAIARDTRQAAAGLQAICYHPSITAERRFRRRQAVLTWGGRWVLRREDRFVNTRLSGLLQQRKPEVIAEARRWRELHFSAENNPMKDAVVLISSWAISALVVVTAVTDYFFTSGLLLDLGDVAATPSGLLSFGGISALGLAAVTVLAVLIVSKPAGILASAWIMGARPSARLTAFGIAMVVSLAALAAIFAGIAQFRLAEQSAAPGAVAAPTALFAVLLSMLPLLAGLAHGLIDTQGRREWMRIKRLAKGRQRWQQAQAKRELRSYRRFADAHHRLENFVNGLRSGFLDLPTQLVEHTTILASSEAGIDPPRIVPGREGWFPANGGKLGPLDGLGLDLPAPLLRRLEVTVRTLREHSLDPARLEQRAQELFAHVVLPAAEDSTTATGTTGATTASAAPASTVSPIRPSRRKPRTSADTGGEEA